MFLFIIRFFDIWFFFGALFSVFLIAFFIRFLVSFLLLITFIFGLFIERFQLLLKRFIEPTGFYFNVKIQFALGIIGKLRISIRNKPESTLKKHANTIHVAIKKKLSVFMCC